MELQGRTLSISMRGDDIALLHRELGQLGFTIPQNEVERQFFGRVTREIVLEFQSRYPDAGLEAGKVDQTTANLINAAVDALHTRQFLVRGQVRQVDNAPLVGLVVRAFDQDPQRGEVLLGEAMTNNDGFYEIPYTSRQFDNYSGDRPGPDLFVRVFNPQGEVLAASSMIHRAQPVETVDLVVEPAKPESPFIVQGQVLYADGRPLAGGRVRAFDKDLRDKQELGTASTNQDGYYRIAYTAEQFRRAEKKSADLLVRVYVTGEEKPTESQIIFNARPVETIDLVVNNEVYRGPSEYERYLTELLPLLGDNQLADLREDEEEKPEEGKFKDISFLTGETGISAERITILALAARLERETRSDTVSFNLEAAVFYGLFLQKLPTELSVLISQSPQVLRRALETSLRDNIIPARLWDDLDNTLARLQQLIVDQAFKKPTTEGRHSLSELLSTVVSSTEQQRAFMTEYVKHEGTPEAFWQKLREIPEFSESGRIEQLQHTFQLAALTANHVPLVQELQRDRTITSLRDLAKLDVAAWQKRINKKVNGKAIGFPPDIEGENDEEKSKNYANILTRIMEDAFPTPVIARHIEKSDVPWKEDLVKFFFNNPEFEFRSYQVDSYLKSSTNALRGARDQDGLVTQLKSMERLFKLTPRYPEMQPLLTDGFDSAHRITQMSQSAFVYKYDGKVGGPAKAEDIYAKAEQASAMALNLLATYGAAFNATEPRVTEILPALKKAFEHNPTWETLFGSLSYCECEHCRSVLSPAAYLVDILHFLRNHHLQDKKPPNQIFPALNILYQRRPDIGNIELTCENTNTPMLCVDLVNEALEGAISPFVPFTLDSALESDLDKRPVSDGLRNAFKNHKLSLSENVLLSIVKEKEWWSITDQGRVYTVKKETGQLRVISVGHQTRGTADELSANPEHLVPAAYYKLAQEIYPWSLPFNLWMEEARTYLEHLGVPRYQLMETFQKQGTPSDPTDLDIATEYLGIIPHEREIITNPSPKDPWRFWGYATNPNLVSWDQALEPVPEFSQKSGLSYQELIELLDARFVNPDKKLHIESTDPKDPATCNIEKLRIEDLGELDLNKMHRFLRLWRKLGWTMCDLDRAITALKPGDLNDAFLIKLSHIKRLRANLKVPLIRMLSWWAPIDTTRYTAEKEAGILSLYEQLFLNKAVTNPVDEIFKLKEPTRDELADTTKKITDRKHIPALLAALGISEADLGLLIEREFTDSRGKVHDKLDIIHLSHLYRLVSISRALKLTIKDFLTLKELMIGLNPFDNPPQYTFRFVNPFDSPENTLRFAERTRKVRATGFSIAELDYLLRHQFAPSSGIVPTENSMALVLDEIRSGLQKIVEETAIVPDLQGEFTRKNLTLLKWDNPLIEEAISNLNSNLYHEATLDALPKNIVFPDDVKDKITYDATARKLKFTGAMTAVEQTKLLNAANPNDPNYPAYETAVDQLFHGLDGQLSKRSGFFINKMKAFALPTTPVPLEFSTHLSALPPWYRVPSRSKRSDFLRYTITTTSLYRPDDGGTAR